MSPSFFFVAAREWTRRGLEEQKRGCPHGPTTGVKVDFFRKQENRLMHYLHFPPSPPSNPHTFFFFFLYTYLHLFPRSVLTLKLSLSHTHTKNIQVQLFHGTFCLWKSSKVSLDNRPGLLETVGEFLFPLPDFAPSMSHFNFDFFFSFSLIAKLISHVLFCLPLKKQNKVILVHVSIYSIVSDRERTDGGISFCRALRHFHTC